MYKHASLAISHRVPPPPFTCETREPDRQPGPKGWKTADLPACKDDPHDTPLLDRHTYVLDILSILQGKLSAKALKELSCGLIKWRHLSHFWQIRQHLEPATFDHRAEPDQAVLAEDGTQLLQLASIPPAHQL